MDLAINPMLSGIFQYCDAKKSPYEIQGLTRSPGQIKEIRCRGKVPSGIRDPHADEILLALGIYPFKRRRDLSAQEAIRIYRKSKEIVTEAMGSAFLKMYSKGGQPCPQMRRL